MIYLFHEVEVTSRKRSVTMKKRLLDSFDRKISGRKGRSKDEINHHQLNGERSGFGLLENFLYALGQETFF